VGHDEIVLITSDAGETWTRTHYAPDAQQPLLDVLCNGRDAIAVGAYSAYFSSKDAGATWTERKFEPTATLKPKAPALTSKLSPARQPETPASPGSGVADATTSGSDFADGEGNDLGSDFHLNRIVAASGSRLYISAEAGRLYRSDDAGATWSELPSPYEGSFFGVLPLNGDSLLAYGLRGNLFRSDDGGLTWRAIETGTQAMLNDAVRLPGGGVAVVGLSGVVLMSGDEGQHFSAAQQDDRKGLSAVLPVGATELVTVGEAGIKVIATKAGR
jgi:photosystem II stability/assembly factor-like uncharacterized protein